MRKKHRRQDTRARLYAGLAVLAASGAAVTVANAYSPEAEAYQAAQPDDEQKKEMAKWPAEKQAAYMNWPAETKAYYWTLSQERQKLFWGLTDQDKVALAAMSAPDQDKAWARIEGRS